MVDQLILRLLDRRGVWMSAVEISDASPAYPEGEYVLTDLKTLVANRLIVPRRRQGMNSRKNRTEPVNWKSS